VLTNPGNPISRLNVDIARQATEKLGVKIEVVEAKNAAEVDGALAQITQLHPDAALIASDTEIAELACPDNQRLARREQRCWPSHRL
ncbi:MAG: hypothetical protein WAK39_18375, partial [Pseudolabrys sp.]